MYKEAIMVREEKTKRFSDRREGSFEQKNETTLMSSSK